MKPILVIGSINTDLVLHAPRFAAPGETLLAHTVSINTGGKGANQAVAAARAGHPTYLIARLGSDLFASKLREDLTLPNLDLTHLTPSEGPTGTALITTTDAGENSILLVPGANATLLPVDLDALRPLLATAGLVLTQLEIPLPTVLRLAELCAEFHVPLMLDPAPAAALPDSLLQLTAWLTPNETELATLTGRPLHLSESQAPADDHSLRQAATDLLARGARNLLLKLGARGALLVLANPTGDPIFHPIAPTPVTPVDTIAAGDVFNGFFAAALLRGLPPLAAAHQASQAAALSTTRPGALPSIPTLADLATPCR